MEEQAELLFLSRLYNTWPWYYDKYLIMGVQRRIIRMQHRELSKLKFTLPVKKLKSKKVKKKEEFPPSLMDW